jgi:hypothetical protein
MLSPRAVRKFKERPRRDFSVWKTISDEELLRRRDKLPVRPPIWNHLKKLQRTCVVIGARQRRFAFFNDTGTGKTFLSIALMRYFDKADIARRNLVLVPNKTNRDEWGTEGFDKHAPNDQYVILSGSSVNKWKLIEDNPDALCFIETYAGFVRMICDLKAVKRKKKTVNKLVPNKKKLQMLAEFFEGVYCDESTYLANRGALPYRLVNKLSQFAETFFILTATPFDRDVTKVWAQMHLVDRGDTLGETLTLFKEAFYDTKVNYWGGYEYTLKKGARQEISRFLDHGSITYPAEESDLPHLTRLRKYCTLGETAESYYQRAADEIQRAHGNYQEMKNAFLRMRQISSGFIGYKDDETGEKARFAFDKNPKLDLLRDLIEVVPERYKFIVYHEFQYSAGVIEKMLNGLGIKHVMVNGKTKDPGHNKKLFRTDPTVRGIVLANSAGGYGLNLQNARYGFYYESPVGAILRKQTEKRFDRQYSLHKNVFLYDLITRGTADESILEFHKEGKNLWKSILNTGNKAIFDR